MFRLSVTGPKGQSNEIQCAADRATIGKGDDNIVVLRGFTVGKRQATIHQRPGGFYIEDHGGLSTTEVNGRMVENEHGPLIPGDVISIAGYAIRILDNGAAAPAAVVAAPPPKPAAPPPPPAPAPKVVEAAPPPPPPPPAPKRAPEPEPARVSLPPVELDARAITN